METKWLEDFVSLAETRSFSRSAQLRHVTQPAFSRRIQSLEAWAGTDLVDRSSYPTRLTPAGETLYDQSLEMLQALQSARAMLRGHTSAAQDVIEFAVPHTLAFTFFPAWVSGLREGFGPIKSRLIALNVHDAVLRLVEGSCDLLIAYHHSSQPFQLDPARYEMVSLGEETIAPYVKPDTEGAPLFCLPGRAGQPLPYLGYAPGAYLGQMVDRFSGSYIMATAGYNAGPGRPAQWTSFCGDPRGGSQDPLDFIECIPFSETRNYVMRVLENTQVYRAKMAGGVAPITLSQDLRRGGYGAPTGAAVSASNP